MTSAWRSDRLVFLAEPRPQQAWLRLSVDDRRAVLEAHVRTIVVNPALRRGAFDSRRLELQRWEEGEPEPAPPCAEPATCIFRHPPNTVGRIVLDSDNQWLDGKQVARLLGVSPGVVWGAISKGLLRAERRLRRRQIRRADVVEFLKVARISPGTLAPLIHRPAGQHREPAPVKAPAPGETWLSTAHVISTLGLTRSRLYPAIDDGALPAYRFGRVIRVRKAEFDELPAGGATSRSLGMRHSPR